MTVTNDPRLNTAGNENRNANPFFNGELLTLAEAAALLKVTRKTLYKWKNDGKIRTVKIAGSLIRIPAADLAALIETPAETTGRKERPAEDAETRQQIRDTVQAISRRLAGQTAAV